MGWTSRSSPKARNSSGISATRTGTARGICRQTAPDKWAQFKAYNLRDVEVELGIQARLREYPAPEEVWAQYRLDQQINDRGIAVDMELVRSAISLDARTRAELTAGLKELTGLDNPNSVQQMKDWLAANAFRRTRWAKSRWRSCSRPRPSR